MPVRGRRPEDEQPLFRAVNERQLMRPVSGEQEETAQATTEQEGLSGAAEEQAAPEAQGTNQGDKGPVAKALDKAQANNWVYDSVAKAAREKGLVAKADELLSKLSGR